MPLMITKNLKVTFRNNVAFTIHEVTIDENGKLSNVVKIISDGFINNEGEFVQLHGNLHDEVLRYLLFEFYTAPVYPAHLFGRG